MAEVGSYGGEGGEFIFFIFFYFLVLGFFLYVYSFFESGDEGVSVWFVWGWDGGMGVSGRGRAGYLIHCDETNTR